MQRWALITGASSGIGRELVKEFAQDEWNIVLTARNESRLKELATEIEARNHVRTRVIATDLSVAGASAELFAATRDLPVAALVNNAGFGHAGEFASTPLDVHQAMIRVNINAMVELTHLFLPGMLERRQGMILNVGSVAAFQPGPTVNIYFATKAFVYSFSYALAVELRTSGVTVTVLNPGSTKTEFFSRARLHMDRPWPLMDPHDVARIGYRAALKGRRSVTPGLVNHLMSLISPCLPSSLTAGLVERTHASRSKPTH